MQLQQTAVRYLGISFLLAGALAAIAALWTQVILQLFFSLTASLRPW